MAVSITGATGTLSHGSSLTISGSGFGTKATAAPHVWDPCDHSDALTARWDGGWPSSGTYALDYRTPSAANGRTVTACPHSRNTRYISGANYPGSSYLDGFNCMGWKNVAITWPTRIYMSWYSRIDPTWAMAGDDNHKWFDYSKGNSPMDNNNWYLESNGGPASYNAHLLDDDSAISTASSNWWGENFPTNPKDAWVKIEVEVLFTNQTSGFVNAWADGTKVLDIPNTSTDATSFGADGESRCIAFGGYSRTYDQSHWRYFTDIYLDKSHCRAIIGNASTLSACTVREIQPPSAWSDSSVTITVNQAAIPTLASAYLYVYDSTGTANSTGYALSGVSGGASPIIFGIRSA